MFIKKCVCIYIYICVNICMYICIYVYMSIYMYACQHMYEYIYMYCESEILSDMYVFFVDTGMICSQPQRQKKMHSFGIGDCFLGGPAVILEPKGRQ